MTINSTATAAVTVAETFLRSLRHRGIDHVFANAGTDHAPIIEAMVKMAALGEPLPRFVTVPHENLAVAMAHGYYLVSGRPAAALVHVTVGTGNTVCAIMNACRDNVPLLLMAGRTPITQSGHIASRTHPIHWGQEAFDQGAVLREYTKWDYELRGGQPVDEVLGRALDVAMAEPRGPVYLTLPREVLADQDTHPALGAVAPPAARPQPSADHLATVGEWIAQAAWPVVVTSHLGRDPAAVAALAAFADRHSIPVVEASPTCLNLPWGHPLHSGVSGTALLEQADLILVAESDVPWFPRAFTPAQRTRVVHLGMDPLYQRYPIRAFPADLVVPGSAATAFALLDQMVSTRTPNHPDAAGRRRQAVADIVTARAQTLQQEVSSARHSKPIRYSVLADCLRAAMPDDSLLVSELGVSPAHLQLSRPGSLLGVGMAGGLGFALGASLGAKLAAPERTVITTLGDGSYMFGNPTPFHLVARAAGLPVLTIVCNNQRWQAVDSSTRIIYPDGLAAAEPVMPLVELQPSPEFSLVAQASGAFARRIDDPDELPEALRQSFAAVAEGQQALLDVRMEHGRR